MPKLFNVVPDVVIPFKILGITNTHEVNEAVFINLAADYLLEFTGCYDYEVFQHYEWAVNATAQTISIPASAFV